MKDIPLLTQKIAAKSICYQSIKDMDNRCLALEVNLNKQKIFGGWINTKDDLCDQLSRNLLSKKNKVCFEIKNDQKNYVLKSLGNKIKDIDFREIETNTMSAETLVIKADFAVLENSSIVFMNKQNRYNFNKFNQIIVLLDIHKVLSKISDLETIFDLFCQTQNSKNESIDIKFIKSNLRRKIISQKFHIGEPEIEYKDIQVKVFFINDGITDVLMTNNMVETLFCLECGECAKVCPVYQITNQYTPIQLVNQVFRNTSFSDKDFMQHSTFCGNCNHVCPMNIQLTDIMLTRVAQYYEKHPLLTNTKSKYYSRRNKMNSLQKKFSRRYFHYMVYKKNSRFQNYLNQKDNQIFNIIYPEICHIIH